MVRFILVFLLLGLTGYVGAQEIKIEKSTEKIVYQGKSYYLHTVKAKETLFSICKAYGVSVDEVKILNDKSDNALSIGDVLRIPVVEPFKSIDDKFYYHRMKPKETLYSLSRKFNIKMKRILKDNPEYDVSRPIAEGAVVRFNKPGVKRWKNTRKVIQIHSRLPAIHWKEWCSRLWVILCLLFPKSLVSNAT